MNEKNIMKTIIQWNLFERLKFSYGLILILFYMILLI